jgi:hypothetical protein
MKTGTKWMIPWMGGQDTCLLACLASCLALPCVLPPCLISPCFISFVDAESSLKLLFVLYVWGLCSAVADKHFSL